MANDDERFVTVSYHGTGIAGPAEPAIDVKDRVLYAHREPYASMVERVEALYPDRGMEGEGYADVLYAQAQESFWHAADEIAQRYGYGRVYAEGRSGGWLHVEMAPELDAEQYETAQTFARTSADAEERAECRDEVRQIREALEKWQAFEAEIEKLIDEARATYPELLGDAIEAHERERAESAAMAARDIETVEG